jgi:hypothetical protein
MKGIKVILLYIGLPIFIIGIIIGTSITGATNHNKNVTYNINQICRGDDCDNFVNEEMYFEAFYMMEKKLNDVNISEQFCRKDLKFYKNKKNEQDDNIYYLINRLSNCEQTLNNYTEFIVNDVSGTYNTYVLKSLNKIRSFNNTLKIINKTNDTFINQTINITFDNDGYILSNESFIIGTENNTVLLITTNGTGGVINTSGGPGFSINTTGTGAFIVNDTNLSFADIEEQKNDTIQLN